MSFIPPEEDAHITFWRNFMAKRGDCPPYGKGCRCADCLGAKVATLTEANAELVKALERCAWSSIAQQIAWDALKANRAETIDR